MDATRIVEVLRATLNPNQREQAEQQLTEVHKIIGFCPMLLQVVMAGEIDMPVRQAGVIYLKNMVTQYWEEKEVAHPTDPVPFNIHEQDRLAIRQNIVEAILQAPEVIRVQLLVCMGGIIKHDYPGRWPDIAEKIAGYINSENVNTWLGALLCLHQLVKNFEYKKPEERNPLNQAMMHLLPMIHQRCIQLLPDQSELSVQIQKQTLKVFYTLIQYYLPLDLISKEMFAQWMELVRQIVERPVPEATLQIDEDERPDLIWWKCKKWALHILARSFERYGSPGNVTKDYKQFSEWYLKSFTGGILQVLLKLLDQYRQKAYVSPRVLQQTLNFLNEGVSHSFSWKFMKPAMNGIVQEIIFPLMCHTDEDQDLWESDPLEYIRSKYDVFEEFLSPVTAAQTLFHSACQKRKEVLSKAMGFCTQLLGTPGLDPRQKAGALHMIGAVADILINKKIYKDQVELMITERVFPEFQSEHGYLRARACWMVHQFCEAKFRNSANLRKAVELVKVALCTDKEMPVRVEAAMAVQMMLTSQEKTKEMFKPYIRQIILDLLNIIRETENEDLTSVLQKFVCTYVAEVTPLAVEITTHLAETFSKVLESNTDGSDEKAITAMGILNTLETICTVMEDQKEILAHLEGVVLSVIGTILQHNVIEFYEEILSLIYSLTCQQISPRMWEVFDMIYQMFQNDGFDYFTEMMPALHNYITVDPAAFMSSPKHIETIYNMCKRVLTGDAGEDAECHACKLLEVILLQYKGQVDQSGTGDGAPQIGAGDSAPQSGTGDSAPQAIPLFVELALERLTREVRTSELRTMCLQVVIAALYYDPPALLDKLEKSCMPNSTEPITAQFLKQWLHDTDCFLGLHDRKVCILGLCALINTPGTRPQAIHEVADKILPAAILIFDGLKKAYASRAEDENEEEEEEEEEDEINTELNDDEDDIDEEGQEYLEKLEKAANGEDSDDDDDDEYDEDAEETALESYMTPLDQEDCDVDEYIIFKNVIQTVERSDPAWYQILTQSLNEQQRKDIQEIFTLSDQRAAAAESKKIEQSGGYMFTQTTVPANFNFTSPPK